MQTHNLPKEIPVKRRLSLELAVILIILFCIFSGFQEVYLGSLFQTVDPILTMVATFGITAVAFSFTQVRGWSAFKKQLRQAPWIVVGLNITTVASWVGFFLALKWIEPAVVSAIALSAGPVVTVLITRWVSPSTEVLLSEHLGAIGSAIGIALLCFTTLKGLGSTGTTHESHAALGVVLSAVCSLGIAGNTFFQKRMSSEGYNPNQVMASRFWLLLIVGLVIGWEPLPGDYGWWRFSVIATVLALSTVMVPLYLLALSIERLEPVTVSLVLSTMPAVTYFFQLFDSRLMPSGLSLVGIFVCLGASVIGVMGRLRSWTSPGATSAETMP
jgi:drug/metabolite transporter (DMT)-like permease